MKTNKLKQSIPIITLLTYIIMVTLNALANILPINGKNTGEISDFYADLFAPAGLTFSIWGIIYILLLGYSIYQLTYYTTENEATKKLLLKINVPFIISSVANSIWILAWHYDFILGSLVLMVIILVSLIRINLILRNTKVKLLQNILVRLPFSIYFGWITVASVANIITYLVSINWNGLGIADYIWADIIIIVAALIGFVATLYYKNIPYNLVIIWAYTGILIKHLSPTGFNGEYASVIAAIIVSMILLVAGDVILIQIKYKQNKLKK